MNLIRDEQLEKLLLKVQEKISQLRCVLNDYIYLDSQSIQHICHVKRDRKTFYNALRKCADALLMDIDSCQNLICKKRYTENHLASKVFEMNLSEKDYFVCNIQVIFSSIKKQHEDIQRNKECRMFKHNDYVIGKCLFLHDMLYDVSEFFDDLYQYKQVEYVRQFQEGKIEEEQMLFTMKYRQRSSKKKLYSSNDILRASNQIKNRYLYKDDIATVPVVIFQMRQIIELRILEILGIRAIVTDDGVLEKITANTFLDMKDFSTDVIMPIDKGTLNKIYTWTCAYVHRGVSGAYWLIDFLYSYLIDFTIEDTFMKESFANTLIERISDYTHVKKENIIMSEMRAARVIKDTEFDEIKAHIYEKGYRKYMDIEKQKELNQMIDMLNVVEKSSK